MTAAVTDRDLNVNANRRSGVNHRQPIVCLYRWPSGGLGRSRIPRFNACARCCALNRATVSAWRFPR